MEKLKMEGKLEDLMWWLMIRYKRIAYLGPSLKDVLVSQGRSFRKSRISGHLLLFSIQFYGLNPETLKCRYLPKDLYGGGFPRVTISAFPPDFREHFRFPPPF